MTWSVRYYAANQADEESGATGFGSQEFAARVFAGLVELVKEKGAGRVELLKDGAVVESFTLPEGA
jgi:hypothetical protein